MSGIVTSEKQVQQCFHSEREKETLKLASDTEQVLGRPL